MSDNRIYPASSSGFLGDEASQLLALRDALDRAHGPAICQAFAEVAHSRGIIQVASMAGISAASLHAALADPERLDLAFLGNVLDALSTAAGPASGGH